jgi:hypothetical protein
MLGTPSKCAYGMIAPVAVLIVALTGWPPAAAAVATDAMPVAEQNTLVQKYCAVCHDDAHRNGGLSLQHFDAAHPDPGVAAMLLSKLTNGLPLERVKAATSDPAASAAIDIEMKNSAINAAGVPAPNLATSRAWVMALSAESAGASD